MMATPALTDRWKGVPWLHAVGRQGQVSMPNLSVFAEWLYADPRIVVGSDFLGLQQVRVSFGWSQCLLNRMGNWRSG